MTEQSGESGAYDAHGRAFAHERSANVTTSGDTTAEQGHLAQDVLQGSYGPAPDAVLDLKAKDPSDSLGAIQQS
jgi:hypothetical protein